MYVEYKGKKYPMITEGFKVRELTYAEGQFGTSLDRMGRFSKTFMAVWVSVNRLDPDALPWDDLAEMTEEKFAELIHETPPIAEPYRTPAEDELPLDPTAAVAQTADRSDSPTPTDRTSLPIG